MKKLVIAVLIFVTFKLSAKDISLTNTGNNNLNRFYIELTSKIGALNTDYGLFGGARVGYNINKDVSLGLTAHGLIPNKIDNSYINQKGRDELHLGYAGVEAAYKYNLSDRFYLTGIMMLGAGRADYEIADGEDYFFIMEPGASINYRLTDWFGLGYSLNYRYASGVKYADFSNASFSGWSMSLDFKFGF